MVLYVPVLLVLRNLTAYWLLVSLATMICGIPGVHSWYKNMQYYVIKA